MSWLNLPRVPEPEVMDDSHEVEAYSSAAAQAYLAKIDDTFVQHAVRLVAGRSVGRALDIGTGPGQIVLKLARRLPRWQWIGVDRSATMIRQAQKSLAACGATLEARDATSSGGVPASHGYTTANGESPMAQVRFFVADGKGLPFPPGYFDLVMCNSVLHHLAQPQLLLGEVARLVKQDGAILIRDLRRPSRWAYPLHVRWYGRHYSGLMYELYCASVRSAYTVSELEELRRASRVDGARVFIHQRTHLGLERSVSASPLL